MKTKKKTYILLIVVVGIWSLIGYRIVTSLNPDLPEAPKQDLALKLDFKTKVKVDTFSIKNADRDPFLGTIYKKKTEHLPSKKIIKHINWLPITYHGMISNKKKSLYIISINGHQHLLKKGQIKDSIKVLYGSSKSVTLGYKDDKKTFKLK